MKKFKAWKGTRTSTGNVRADQEYKIPDEVTEADAKLLQAMGRGQIIEDPKVAQKKAKAETGDAEQPEGHLEPEGKEVATSVSADEREQATPPPSKKGGKPKREPETK